MPRKQPESATSRRKIERLDRAAQALALRRQGATYADIARTGLFRSSSGVRNAILRVMKRIIPLSDVEHVRQLECARLDELQLSVYHEALGRPQVTDAAGKIVTPAQQRNRWAFERVMDIIRLRAQISGAFSTAANAGIGDTGEEKGLLALPDACPTQEQWRAMVDGHRKTKKGAAAPQPEAEANAPPAAANAE